MVKLGVLLSPVKISNSPKVSKLISWKFQLLYTGIYLDIISGFIFMCLTASEFSLQFLSVLFVQSLRVFNRSVFSFLNCQNLKIFYKKNYGEGTEIVLL